MDITRACDFIESSFLKEKLLDETITDISFNGRDFFCESYRDGKSRPEFDLSFNEVFNFIKQIANLLGKNFSFSQPILDLAFDRYRLNAVFYNIAQFSNAGTVTFSLRIYSDKIRYVPPSLELKTLLHKLVNSSQSLLIYGMSGSGKTELQKYLISLYEDYTRVIVIDNINEIGLIKYDPNIDISYWIVPSGNQEISSEHLIENALRSNPQKLILAEARGKEMLDVLNASLTGHPSIVTIHAEDASKVYARAARMCLDANPTLDYVLTKTDLEKSFPILIEMKKEILKDGTTKRQIQKIVERKNNEDIKVLYSLKNGGKK